MQVGGSAYLSSRVSLTSAALTDRSSAERASVAALHLVGQEQLQKFDVADLPDPGQR